LHKLVGSIEDIDICNSNILPSSHILRSVAEKLDELVRSIKRIGLLQPIIVRTCNASFEIIARNRRFEACRQLGLKNSLSCSWFRWKSSLWSFAHRKCTQTFIKSNRRGTC